jgi:hypothetical protein
VPIPPLLVLTIHRKYMPYILFVSYRPCSWDLLSKASSWQEAIGAGTCLSSTPGRTPPSVPGSGWLWLWCWYL